MTSGELDKGLKILKRHGCSDLFPDAFEILAIDHSWGKIRPVLENVDLLNFVPQSGVKLVAPRQRYTTRKITLIDPIDAVLLNAVSLRIGPRIEAVRTAHAGTVVFSCRVDPSQPDELFDFRANHDGFVTACRVRVKKRSCKFLATADINDFYPRIYLHRLENSLDSILNDNLQTRVCMRFLEEWSSGTSYGIPVGPHFSHLFAEATLYEVDTYLISQKIDFIRYVDDYIFFGESEAECLRSLFLLGSRLQETQGLSLNSAKTRVWTARDYKDRLDMRDQPAAKLRKMIEDKVFGGDFYHDITYDELTPNQKRLLNKLDIPGVLDAALAKEDLTDFASIKFILNVMSALSRPELTDLVLNNLGKLHPVSSAVAKFFRVFDNIDSVTRHQISARIVDFINDAKYIPEFQAMWLLDVFAKAKDWNSLEGIRRIAQNDQSMIVRRQAILALGQIGDRSSLLDVKGRVDSTISWETRAIVYACRSLPKDEKEAFLKTVRVPNDWKIDSLLLKSVVEYSKKN
jgi:hypothetical protein